MSDPSPTFLDQSIRTRLISLENSFFQSLQSGTEALAAFHLEMSGFNQAVCVSAKDLDDETLSLIHAFVQTSNAVLPGLIDLNVTSERINQELKVDISKVFDELSLNDTAYPFQGPFLFSL